MKKNQPRFFLKTQLIAQNLRAEKPIIWSIKGFWVGLRSFLSLVLCLSPSFESRWQFPTLNGCFSELCLSSSGLYAFSVMLFMFSSSSPTPFSPRSHINLQPLYWIFTLFHPLAPHPPEPPHSHPYHLLYSSPSSLVPTSIQACSYTSSTRVFAS